MRVIFQYNIGILCCALMLMSTVGERQYFVPIGNRTWDDARSHCQICYKELVTLTPENSHLITKMLSSDRWIGLRKNFNSTNNSSMSFSRWANGDPLFFQNWYPGWPVFKSPPPKIDCCSCSCTCPANTATETMTSSPPVTENPTETSSLFASLDQNYTNVTSMWESITSEDQNYTNVTSMWESITSEDQNYTNVTSFWPSTSSGSVYSTFASPLRIEAACERTPMPVFNESSDNESYIEDSCVAMLSFGAWIEMSCLESLPFVCYEDRFFGQVNVTNVTLNNATLTWMDAPGNISHYRVQVTGYPEMECNLTSLTHNLKGLTPGGYYEVQVFPVKCERDLNPENASFYTTPNKVTNLSITDVKETSVNLTWNKPDGNLSFYLIKKGSQNLTEKEDGTVSYPVKDLMPGTIYTFTVLTGVKDRSRWSEESHVTTNTKPGKVSSLQASNTTNTAITLHWTAPDGDFTGFNVMVDGNESNCKLENKESRSAQINGLSSGSKYRLSVTTLANFTEFSNLTNPVTEGDEESIYAHTAPAPISNLELETDESSVIATWQGAFGSSSCFNVTLQENGKEKGSEKVTDTSKKFDGLKSSANYTVIVSVLSGLIESSPVKASKFTLPSPPTNAVATGSTSSSITFTWDASHNAETVSYVVQLNSTIWGHNKVDNTSSTSHTFLNLKSGSKYDFQVFAKVENHTSNPARCTKTTVSEPVEISLSMLCSSHKPLFCDKPESKIAVINQLEKYFKDKLNDNIVWIPPTLRDRT